MKGVVVQVGEPKSIVLFNNGKIGAINTPPDCHVGMVVTVKFNGRLKILIISLAAVLLVGFGIFIGVNIAQGRRVFIRPPAPGIMRERPRPPHEGNLRPPFSPPR